MTNSSDDSFVNNAAIDRMATDLIEERPDSVDALFSRAGYPPPIHLWRPEATGNAPLDALLGLWTAAVSDGRVPLRRDIDPLSVPALIGQMSVLELVDGRDFRYRLMGTEVARSLGQDWTGRTLGERSQTGGLLAMLLFAQCRAVLTNRTVLYSCHAAMIGDTPPPQADRPWATSWERLALPLRSSASPTPDLVLIARQLRVGR